MRERLAQAPKAELHVHLDGSLRPATMLELAREQGIALPAGDPELLRKWMLVDDAGNLEDYLRRFDVTIALLQDPDAIERVAYEMVLDAHADNLRYLEVRYCPRLSTAGGLSMDEAVAAEWRGLVRGMEQTGVIARIINCSLRQYDPERSIEIAEHSLRMKSAGVVGFDLAGGEAGRPPERHRQAFDIAARGGLGITVHAGEAAGWESIFEAIHSCHAVRIGHGTRLVERPELLEYVRDRRILVEVNITSNLQTRAVPTASEHPVRRFVDEGLAVTLCTDSWLMSGVSLTDEYVLAQEALGFSRVELDRMILDGFAHAFLPWPMRLDLIERATAQLEALP
ncbi:MAG TPA: adenosine deaminase [Gemmatimonadales bacterium]|nr:adenosine deaminase [Gemmatimonadales bacterium]